jgi:quinol monooxygenase YgiN
VSELLVVARHTITAGKEDEVLAALPKLVEATRAEPGALEFTCYRQLDDPRTYVLIERYRSREAFLEHRQTDHFKELVEGHIAPRLDERVWKEYRAAD